MNNRAPLYESLKALADKNTARFHMPGHKGRALFSQLDSIYAIDFTEIYETGNLFYGDEPIISAEKLAAEYFGAADCLFTTGGSTQALMTAICTAVGLNGHMIVDRNCHKSIVNTMALLDITPHFIFPKVLSDFNFTERIDISELISVIEDNPLASAVLVTSPNYYGICQDIAAISEVCKKYGKVLIVDEAHGAHFPALKLPNAVSQGADLAAVSAHKTLPALGQSALLLSNGRFSFDTLCKNTAIFGTSSPSYLLMASLDLCRAYMEVEGDALYHKVARDVAKLRAEINNNTVFSALSVEFFKDLDPCRLTVNCTDTSVTGHELSDWLYTDYNIAAEMSDENNVVFILTCADTDEKCALLRRALTDISASKRVIALDKKSCALPSLPKPQQVRSVREALFCKSVSIPVCNAASRICAKPVTPYPPGVPIIYPGEQISELHVEFLLKQCYTTIKEISVIP